MTELYDLLSKIQRKPGMYIGSPSVSDLFMFLCGYHHSHQELGIPFSEQEKEFREFQPWLQKKFKISTSASWARVILLYSADEADAFKNFFDLLAEFKAQQKQPSTMLASDGRVSH
ncbi:hypothetical protein [Aerosakkonema funiforme]|uniref:Uncharacterized protein n=1 Tax=Aerosakkonema funiforme FACHB-1375 TaxID=2949571 RepID=A0A926VHG9_9CYAN|nr:hypothetical protein [Aerosakkonema funiforme]MBD2183872.1 hypothetical protein [Aerosakkonema funiforme FACHB-1375]